MPPTFLPMAVSELCFLHPQVLCDLQPAEGAVQPAHQQTLRRADLTTGFLTEERSGGLYPRKRRDPGRLSLYVCLSTYRKPNKGVCTTTNLSRTYLDKNEIISQDTNKDNKMSEKHPIEDTSNCNTTTPIILVS